MMEEIASWPGFVWFGGGMAIFVSSLLGVVTERWMVFFIVLVVSTSLFVFVFYLTRMWVYGY